jgi:D-alanyl-D-alanine carboxypeptidase-like protein/putative Flp pilus-assembly TadE/G-like protein
VSQESASIAVVPAAPSRRARRAPHQRWPGIPPATAHRRAPAAPYERRAERGQAALLLLGLLLAACIGAVVLGSIARGISTRGDLQRAADLAALAAARAMHDAYPRVFAPPTIDSEPNAQHLERGEYLDLARRAADDTAARNGAAHVTVAFPGGGLAPIRVRVAVHDAIAVGDRAHVANTATAEAELAPPGAVPGDGLASAGEYRGPFATRQGKRMRPDVALAFDRMAAAAHGDGVALLITSAFRSNGEQARLFAQHPDPKWVAPPGQSLHRLATELDLGPPAAYGWLARNAEKYHFTQRYSWEPWH